MSGPWPEPTTELLPFQLGYWRFLRNVVRASGNADAVIMRGTSGFSEGYAEAVAALLIKARYRHPPRVVVSDASWDLTSASLERRIPRFARSALRGAGRLAVRLPDGRHVRYGVLSSSERDAFEERWGIDGERVFFTPFCATVSGSAAGKVKDGDYVVAGGNTNRDYDLLVEAVGGLDVPVRIASSWTPGRPLPPNVVVAYQPTSEYDALVSGSRLVVVPIRPSARSVGQQTFLSAMLLGKPVIVTEAPGVLDYIIPDETGIVIPRHADALRDSILWVLDPANAEAVAAMVHKARATVEECYLPRHYMRRLWDLAVSSERGWSAPRPRRVAPDGS